MTMLRMSDRVAIESVPVGDLGSRNHSGRVQSGKRKKFNVEFGMGSWELSPELSRCGPNSAIRIPIPQSYVPRRTRHVWRR